MTAAHSRSLVASVASAIAIATHLVVLAGCELASKAVNTDIPPIEVFLESEGIMEFGRVLEGTPVVGNFRLVNPTADVIRITGIATECGCLVPDQSVLSKTIDPGGSLEISVELVTANNTGNLNKRVKFSYEIGHPGRIGEVVAVLKGYVAASLSVNPVSIDFGLVHPGQTYMRTLVISSEIYENFSVTRVESPYPQLDWKALSKQPSREEVSLVLAADGNLGDAASDLSLVLAGHPISRLSIAVDWQHYAPIITTPPAIRLSAKGVALGRFSVTKKPEHGGIEWLIESPSSVSVQQTESTSTSSAYQIRIVRPLDGEEVSAGHIRIKFRPSDRFEEIRLPYAVRWE